MTLTTNKNQVIYIYIKTAAYFSIYKTTDDLSFEKSLAILLERRPQFISAMVPSTMSLAHFEHILKQNAFFRNLQHLKIQAQHHLIVESLRIIDVYPVPVTTEEVAAKEKTDLFVIVRIHHSLVQLASKVEFFVRCY